MGLSIIDRTQPADRWPADLGTHAHYNNWDLSGPKARFETGALCDMAPLVRKLTVVIPPWAPRYVRSADPVWAEKDDQVAALVAIHSDLLPALTALERALKARNGLLRRGGVARELLESYDETLAQAGARVVVRRRELAEALAPRFAAAFLEIHGNGRASLGTWLVLNIVMNISRHKKV